MTVRMTVGLFDQPRYILPLKVLHKASLFGPNCTWVTFHGGYDFWYLIKVSTNSDLPRDLGIFSNLLWHYFGNSMYNIKAMMKLFRLGGGLELLAACFNLVRVAGKSHQAGSDSLLTMQLFVKVKQWCVYRHYVTALSPCMPYGLNLEVNWRVEI